MKYLNTQITFAEIPDEISLCINLTNCPNNCEGCHSPQLRKDIGSELTEEVLAELIKKSKGITCVCFMGGDSDESAIADLTARIVHPAGLKSAWYSGKDREPGFYDLCFFDYMKFGHYDKELGPLSSPTTNQRLWKNNFESDNGLDLTDITEKFWKK